MKSKMVHKWMAWEESGDGEYDHLEMHFCKKCGVCVQYEEDDEGEDERVPTFYERNWTLIGDDDPGCTPERRYRNEPKTRLVAAILAS